jgi:hypothetical protein
MGMISVMADELSRVPTRLRENVERWHRHGRRRQPGMRWNRLTWQETLPEYKDFLAGLPDLVDRETAAGYGARAADGAQAAGRAFVAAMIWGYGPVGYGAFRTARLLRKNPGAGERLREVAEQVCGGGGVEAFRGLADDRLHFLGVAFATKYVYFCGGADGQRALILDRLVQRWLRRHAGAFVRLDWRVKDYELYLDLAQGWASCLGVTPAQVEYLMFLDTASDEPVRREPATRADDAVDEMDLALDALDEATAAGAAVPGMTATDLDDYERAIRQARRVLLARDTGRGSAVKGNRCGSCSTG